MVTRSIFPWPLLEAKEAPRGTILLQWRRETRLNWTQTLINWRTAWILSKPRWFTLWAHTTGYLSAAWGQMFLVYITLWGTCRISAQQDVLQFHATYANLMTPSIQIQCPGNEFPLWKHPCFDWHITWRNPRKKDSRCQPRSFKCKWQDCSYGRQFSSLPTVWRHIQSILISPSEYNCPVCGKTFGLGRGDKLGNHMKVAHPK